MNEIYVHPSVTSLSSIEAVYNSLHFHQTHTKIMSDCGKNRNAKRHFKERRNENFPSSWIFLFHFLHERAKYFWQLFQAIFGNTSEWVSAGVTAISKRHVSTEPTGEYYARGVNEYAWFSPQDANAYGTYTFYRRILHTVLSIHWHFQGPNRQPVPTGGHIKISHVTDRNTARRTRAGRLMKWIKNANIFDSRRRARLCEIFFVYK